MFCTKGRQDLGSPGLLFPDLAGAGTPMAVPGCVGVLTTPKNPVGAQEDPGRALGRCSGVRKGNGSNLVDQQRLP